VQFGPVENIRPWQPEFGPEWKDFFLEIVYFSYFWGSSKIAMGGGRAAPRLACCELPLVSPYGDLAQRKIDYLRTNEVKNLKKIANPQALSIKYLLFSSFSLKFSHYIV
jgi:hypothetical protein